MNLIQNIPSIISLVSALIVLTISLQQNIKFSSMCLRISITLMIFYVVGMIIRKVFVSILKEVQMNKEEEARQEKRNLEQKQDHSKEDEEFLPFQAKELGKKEAKIIANAIKDV